MKRRKLLRLEANRLSGALCRAASRQVTMSADSDLWTEKALASTRVNVGHGAGQRNTVGDMHPPGDGCWWTVGIIKRIRMSFARTLQAFAARDGTQVRNGVLNGLRPVLIEVSCPTFMSLILYLGLRPLYPWRIDRQATKIRTTSDCFDTAISEYSTSTTQGYKVIQQSVWYLRERCVSLAR